MKSKIYISLALKFLNNAFSSFQKEVYAIQVSRIMM